MAQISSRAKRAREPLAELPRTLPRDRAAAPLAPGAPEDLDELSALWRSATVDLATEDVASALNDAELDALLGETPLPQAHDEPPRGASGESLPSSLEPGAGAARFKGVAKLKNGRYQACIHRGGKREHLGTFDTAVEAAVAVEVAVAAVAVVTAGDAEGLRLHVSSRSGTGYLGVRREPSGSYQAKLTRGGKTQILGMFDTAVEAARAFARAAGPPPEEPDVTEAEGLRLHLSSTSPTGYMGVSEEPSGRFRARYKYGGHAYNLGLFDTAVEAAVAVACRFSRM